MKQILVSFIFLNVLGSLAFADDHAQKSTVDSGRKVAGNSRRGMECGKVVKIKNCGDSASVFLQAEGFPKGSARSSKSSFDVRIAADKDREKAAMDYQLAISAYVTESFLCRCMLAETDKFGGPTWSFHIARELDEATRIDDKNCL